MNIYKVEYYIFVKGISYVAVTYVTGNNFIEAEENFNKTRNGYSIKNIEYIEGEIKNGQ